MADSYYTLTGGTSGLWRFAATEHTVGPWSASAQHGGPPTALAVTAADRTLRAETGRDDLVALRLAADFVGAVPVGALEVTTRVVRVARSAALLDVALTADDRTCLTARVWFVRDADTAAVAPPLPDAQVVPDVPTGLGADFGYGASMEWRFLHGGITRPGPAAVWAHPTLPLVADWAIPGLARAALVADSAGGVSSMLDWSQWSFANVDLDLHLARPFVGEWVLLDATTQLGAHGSALARSTLSDVHGVVGGGLQTLVLSPRRPD